MKILSKNFKSFCFLLIFFALEVNLFADNPDSIYFAQNYSKTEVKIKMRDGVKLFSAIYTPKNNLPKHPIIIWRTPYSCRPYGEKNFFTRGMQTFIHFIKENYIIVMQDVRGRFMSEGTFIDMRPYIPNKKSNKDADESSDAYDTIDWLVNNVENNNGKVGVWGISYPGFYAAMAAIDAHPALKAVSPQAPIADWFIDDDMHHNGALTLIMNFNFFDIFGLPRKKLTTEWPDEIDRVSPDAYNFFLKLGPLANINNYYYKHNIAFWDSAVAHPNYDSYWQKKNTLTHFKNIKPSVLTVGGLYDAEDLYGAINTYKSIEKNNPNTNNNFVMGPWPHGGWTRIKGDKFGDIDFGSETSKFYVDSIELPFFNYYLKGVGTLHLPEAYIFETGKNIWRKFEKYPPKNIEQKNIYLNSEGKLIFNKPTSSEIQYDEYISNPNKPVPYTAKVLDSKKFYYKEFMNEDQRFAATRPDVLVYESEPLTEDFSLAGPMQADIYVSTSGTDCDWVVKIIDEYPDDAIDINNDEETIEMGGYQSLLRADIFRSRYRNSFENPEPMIPNQITEVKINLNDVCHTFLKDHKIMVQIQSSWFPMFDRNPQTFVNIYTAKESDFQKAKQRVYFSKEYPSRIIINKMSD